MLRSKTFSKNTDYAFSLILIPHTKFKLNNQKKKQMTNDHKQLFYLKKKNIEKKNQIKAHRTHDIKHCSHTTKSLIS